MTEYDPNATVSYGAVPAGEPGGPPGFTEPDLGGPRVEYHWVRGAIWGFVLGLGLGVYALIFRFIEFRQLPFWLIVLAGVVLGVLWARFAPPKQ